MAFKLFKIANEKKFSKWIKLYVNEDFTVLDSSTIFVVGITNKQSELRILRIDAKSGGIENMKRISVNSNFDFNT